MLTGHQALSAHVTSSLAALSSNGLSLSPSSMVIILLANCVSIFREATLCEFNTTLKDAPLTMKLLIFKRYN